MKFEILRPPMDIGGLRMTPTLETKKLPVINFKDDCPDSYQDSLRREIFVFKV